MTSGGSSCLPSPRLLLTVSNAQQGRVPEGDARELMCLVPVYALTAKVKNESGWTTLLASAAMFAGLYAIIFSTGGGLT